MRITASIYFHMSSFPILQDDVAQAFGPRQFALSSNALYNMAQYVVLETSMGPINLELYSDHAPKTCRNFSTLASRNYYNGESTFREKMCWPLGDSRHVLSPLSRSTSGCVSDCHPSWLGYIPRFPCPSFPNEKQAPSSTVSYRTS